MKPLFFLFFGFLTISYIDAKICNCRIAVQPRISNGKIIKGTIPWQVMIRYNKETVCNGVLAGPKYVLTSANCVYDKIANRLDIIPGISNLSAIMDVEKYAVDYVRVHPDFSPYKLDNGSDLAVLQLSNPVKFQPKKVELACLGLDSGKFLKNETFMASGFGTIDESLGNFSDVNRYAYFQKKEISNLQPNIIETRSMTPNVTICTGDEGSPLHLLSYGKTEVVGLASYTESGFDNEGNVKYCGDDAFFTRLYGFRTWITKQLDGQYCSLL